MVEQRKNQTDFDRELLNSYSVLDDYSYENATFEVNPLLHLIEHSRPVIDYLSF